MTLDVAVPYLISLTVFSLYVVCFKEKESDQRLVNFELCPEPHYGPVLSGFTCNRLLIAYI